MEVLQLLALRVGRLQEHPAISWDICKQVAARSGDLHHSMELVFFGHLESCSIKIGQAALYDCFQGQFFEVVSVHPIQLGEVKHRPRLAHSFQREGLAELFEAVKLTVVCRMPAQEGNKIDQCFFEIAFLQVAFHAYVVHAFAELAAVLVEDKGQMNPLGRFPA